MSKNISSQAKPNYWADIIPNHSAAGYKLGMNFHVFMWNIADNFIEVDDLYSCINQYKDIWLLNYFSNEFFPDTKNLSWNNTVILRFNQNNQLYAIFLRNGYQGTLFSQIAIGYNIDKMIENFYPIFYADVYFLAEKSQNKAIIKGYIQCHHLFELDIDNIFDVMSIIDEIKDIHIIDGVEIKTNYLTKYCEQYSDQIVQEIVVFKK
ncbi:hypothetical protein [Acinetobacter sp. c3-l95]|uniref:hypothetical protein n=1 Tax=Acinetobacter sp. c3-l95 TaxID=3342804 RepID=UPI0035B850AA